MAFRTDLAVEVLESNKSAASGFSQHDSVLFELPLSETEIFEKNTVLQRDAGKYFTLSVQALLHREQESFSRTCHAVAQLLKRLQPSGIAQDAPVLIIGLGNRSITPDAVGPLTCENVLATRHLLRQTPEQFQGFRPTAVIAPGVLGMTGVETGEIVRGIIDRIAPSMVIAVDALAARRLSRLMCTIQLTDTGIVPGSGVGNARTALTQKELGIPVIAVGVPTVVDGATLAADIIQQTGAQCEALEDLNTPVLVTTRDVDTQVSDLGRVIGYGINLFLHPDLTIEDIDLFLS